MTNQRLKVTRGGVIHASVSMVCVILCVMGYVRWSQWPDFGFGTEINENNAVVTKIYPDSPAEEVGVQVGDVVIEIAGVPFTRENNRQALRAGLVEPGKTATIVIERNGKRIAESITPMSLYSVILNKGLDILQFLILVSAGIIVMAQKPVSTYRRMLAYVFLAVAVFFGSSFTAPMLTWTDIVRREGSQVVLFSFP